jgi:DNA polymerase-3 subunit delta'
MHGSSENKIPARVVLEHAVSRGQLSHAYLLVGPQLQEVAGAFAQSVVCEENRFPACGECLGCRKFLAGNHPDVHWIRPDGTAVKALQIREMQRAITFRPLEARRNVCLIEKAEALTPVAANGLLKFLEEPDAPVVAILLTRRLDLILPTIRSRCQIIFFPRDQEEHRAGPVPSAGMQYGKDARLLAYLRIQDPIGTIALTQDEKAFAEIVDIMLELSDSIIHRSDTAMFTVWNRVANASWTPEKVNLLLSCLACWFRDLLFVQQGIADRVLFTGHVDRLREQGRHVDFRFLTQAVRHMMLTMHRIGANANPQLALEAMIFQMKGV